MGATGLATLVVWFQFMKIGFVGAGSMAAAMARGWSRADGVLAEMIFSDADEERAEDLADELDAEVAENNEALADHSDLLVLAMKPANLPEVAEDLEEARMPVISILGATSLATLREALPQRPIVRVIPNIAAEVRHGVLCYAFSEGSDEDFRDNVAQLLGALGTALETPEEQIDTATAVMSCPPAYVALVCETLLAAATRHGIPEPAARRMVVETIAGTGALMRERDPAAVRAAVASPGGITERGLEVLAEKSFAEALDDAVEASLEKMRGQ